MDTVFIYSIPRLGNPRLQGWGPARPASPRLRSRHDRGHGKLILEHLRAIRAKLDQHSDEFRAIRRRVSSLETQMANVHSDLANVHSDLAILHGRIDAVEERLDRIEKRLDLATA
ncbi:MAG: hypothetical protein RML56_07220 [Burkholderiales bacterium]|nr:hypothetical protein [Burkholderiales bacterium]